ncbi:hypothetical protein DLH72_01405 [Candidatus Gracilibacteria bacterium]|nr:MAG: hypothetical protein DLH72_01405 [Candidatus Gracilibacteria bacterium]
MEKIYINDFSGDYDKLKVIKPLIKGNKLDLEIIYKSDFAITKDLRDFLEAILIFFSVPEKSIARIILISDELNNNAIEHGSDKNGINILRLRVEKEDNKININLEVEDNGKGKDATDALSMETMRAHKLKRGYREHDSIRGRGLFLITVQIVDRLYFKNSKSGGLIVGIKKEICL